MIGQAKPLLDRVNIPADLRGLPESDLRQLADELGIPLLGQVPLVPALRHGGDVGQPITVVDPHGEAASAFAAIAQAVAGLGKARIFRPELTIH